MLTSCRCKFRAHVICDPTMYCQWSQSSTRTCASGQCAEICKKTTLWIQQQQLLWLTGLAKPCTARYQHQTNQDRNISGSTDVQGYILNSVCTCVSRSESMFSCACDMRHHGSRSTTGDKVWRSISCIVVLFYPPCCTTWNRYPKNMW